VSIAEINYITTSVEKQRENEQMCGTLYASIALQWAQGLDEPVEKDAGSHAMHAKGRPWREEMLGLVSHPLRVI
jgi:hypothetical protein